MYSIQIALFKEMTRYEGEERKKKTTFDNYVLLASSTCTTTWEYSSIRRRWHSFITFYAQKMVENMNTEYTSLLG